MFWVSRMTNWLIQILVPIRGVSEVFVNPDIQQYIRIGADTHHSPLPLGVSTHSYILLKSSNNSFTVEEAEEY